MKIWIIGVLLHSKRYYVTPDKMLIEVQRNTSVYIYIFCLKLKSESDQPLNLINNLLNIQGEENMFNNPILTQLEKNLGNSTGQMI